MRRGIVSVALCCFLLLGSGNLVRAYDNDTHYVLTYYLARRVGFSPTQAHQIASGDVSTDYDSKVEPLQVGEVFDPWGDAQTPRVLFHAFPDSRTYDKIKAIQQANGLSERAAGDRATEFALEERDKWQATLWQRAKASGNPGLYLHFYQDIYSHDGFWSRLGHGFPPPLPGHSPDFLSYRPDKAAAMMSGTIGELQRFMHECLPREPLVPDKVEAEQVLQQLIAVNPYDTAENLVLRYNFNGRGVPDWTKALEIVNGALGGQGGAVANYTIYHFDADGNPLDDNWKLEGCREPLKPGRLWVKVVADDTGEPLAGAKVEVTFPGSTEVLASGTTANGGVPPLDLVIRSTGMHQVKASLPGYGSGSTVVELPFEGSAIAVIHLPNLAGEWTGKIGNSTSTFPARINERNQDGEYWGVLYYSSTNPGHFHGKLSGNTLPYLWYNDETSGDGTLYLSGDAAKLSGDWRDTDQHKGDSGTLTLTRKTAPP